MLDELVRVVGARRAEVMEELLERAADARGLLAGADPRRIERFESERGLAGGALAAGANRLRVAGNRREEFRGQRRVLRRVDLWNHAVEDAARAADERGHLGGVGP